MSTPVSPTTGYLSPAVVPATDKPARRTAARVVLFAYLTEWRHLALFAAACGATGAIFGWALHFSAAPTAVLAAGGAVVGAIYQATANAVLTYNAPTLDRELWLYLNPTTGDASALLVQPDTRRGAASNERLASTFGSWPRGAGHGTILGNAVLAHHRLHDLRLTGTALPGTAKAYIRRGMVRSGSTNRLLWRVGDPTVAPSCAPARQGRGGPLLIVVLVALAGAVLLVRTHF